MFSSWFPKTNNKNTDPSSRRTDLNRIKPSDVRPLPYSWIKSGQLAIGPMPKSRLHWQQLEADNFNRRFSCCYPFEHIFEPIPSHWTSQEVSLPDHRSQDILSPDVLAHALLTARAMMSDYSSGPLYLHCFAGQERSALLAIGLICLVDNKDLFDSLNHVRECHKIARPIYSQLDLLERLLKNRRLYFKEYL